MKIIFCGDIHGDLECLVWMATEKLGIKDAHIIVVGDFGAGFTKKSGMDIRYEKVHKKLEKNNIILSSIRGNHDDPSWFDGSIEYPRLKFLEDYKVINIESTSILPIGGAISIDRDYRIKLNSEQIRWGSPRRFYWPTEDVKRVDLDTLPEKVDIVISHDAPKDFYIPLGDMDIKKDILDDIENTRQYLSGVLDRAMMDKWYFGHYHKSVTGTTLGVDWTGLGIMELKEYIKHE